MIAPLTTPAEALADDILSKATSALHLAMSIEITLIPGTHACNLANNLVDVIIDLQHLATILKTLH
jgi:hypothetical protein